MGQIKPPKWAKRSCQKQEGTFDDNSREMVYGHTAYLDVPQSLYPSSQAERDNLQDQLRNDINEIIHIPNEFISAVFLEMEEAKDRDWRSESGVLLPRRRTVTSAATERIWGTEGYRVFLSHKAEVKNEAAELKRQLEIFGVSAFVAHQDIHPTKEWQDEIENALASMDAFVALLTKEFHNSLWTDQEVGYALARGVPMIAVKLGKAPYGFIGRFQALSSTWKGAGIKLLKLLIKQPRMLDCYIAAVPKCCSFDDGNRLSQLLPDVEVLTMKQAEQLMAAFNKNRQLRESFGFTGEKSASYGIGLAAHLSRMTGKKYSRTSSGEIKIKKE